MAKRNPTREIPLDVVNEFLRYEPDTGRLTWKKKPARRIVVGSEAGCVRKGGDYVIVGLLGESYYAHRLVWAITHGISPDVDLEIDHRDGDKTNNRISNLRIATHTQNKHNIGLLVNNTSGVKGVTLRKRDLKWQAQISVREQCVYLGSFRNFEDAVAARKRAEERYCGEFNYQRSPSCQSTDETIHSATRALPGRRHLLRAVDRDRNR